MKKFNSFIMMLVLLFSTNFAQDESRISTPILLFLQNNNIDAINSIGFSNITHSMTAEVGSGNPAALADNNSIATGLTFEAQSTIDYFGLDLDRAKQWLPSNFGFVLPYHDLRIGLSYHQKYSRFLDYGKIKTSTIQNPQGTGEYFNASSEIIIHSPSALISYTFNNIFTEEDRFSVGGQLFLDFWQEEEMIGSRKSTLSANDISWKTGLTYTFNPRIKMAAIYEKGIDMEGELIQKDSDLYSIDPLDSTGFIRVTKLKIKQKINMPDKISFGVTAQASDYILLSSAFTFVFWNEINNEFKNQIDFSANAIFTFSEILDFTMGVYITDREIKNRELLSSTIPQNAAYLNFGIKAKMENIILQTELLDSHLLSADHREHTIFKVGCNYLFDD